MRNEEGKKEREDEMKKGFRSSEQRERTLSRSFEKILTLSFAMDATIQEVELSL